MAHIHESSSERRRRGVGQAAASEITGDISIRAAGETCALLVLGQPTPQQQSATSVCKHGCAAPSCCVGSDVPVPELTPVPEPSCTQVPWCEQEEGALGGQGHAQQEVGLQVGVLVFGKCLGRSSPSMHDMTLCAACMPVCMCCIYVPHCMTICFVPKHLCGCLSVAGCSDDSMTLISNMFRVNAQGAV
jgi:hypothetical protein